MSPSSPFVLTPPSPPHLDPLTFAGAINCDHRLYTRVTDLPSRNCFRVVPTIPKHPFIHVHASIFVHSYFARAMYPIPKRQLSRLRPPPTPPPPCTSMTTPSSWSRHQQPISSRTAATPRPRPLRPQPIQRGYYPKPPSSSPSLPMCTSHVCARPWHYEPFTRICQHASRVATAVRSHGWIGESGDDPIMSWLDSTDLIEIRRFVILPVIVAEFMQGHAAARPTKQTVLSYAI